MDIFELSPRHADQSTQKYPRTNSKDSIMSKNISVLHVPSFYAFVDAFS